MKALEPIRKLRSLEKDFERIFGEPFFRSFLPSREEHEESTWYPAVDLSETEKNIELRIEVPGVDPQDIKVELEDSTLVIKGEKKFEKEGKEKHYHMVERFYGNFYRRFNLPEMVDKEGIKADYKQGVLTVTLPKREAAKTKVIEVKEAA